MCLRTIPIVVLKLRTMAGGMIADIGSGKSGPGVRPPGTNNNPVTLYPTVPKRRRPKNAKKISWNKIKVGDNYPSEVAPKIANKPFTIECRISEAADGVVVAHGGSVVGYSLYVRGNKLTFAVRTSNSEIRRVDAESAKGKTNQIKATLNADGVLTLFVDGKTVSAKVPVSATSHLIGKQPQEPLSIGYDSRNPVDSEAPKSRFKGKIEMLKIAVMK